MSFLQTYLTLIPPALAFHSILALLRVVVWQKQERWCNVLGTATVLPLAFISLMASRYAVTVLVDGSGGGAGFGGGAGSAAAGSGSGDDGSGSGSAGSGGAAFGGGEWHWRKWMVLVVVWVWTYRLVRYHLERFARTEDAKHVARDARFNKTGRGRRGVVDAFVWQLAWSLVCVLPVVLVHAVPDEVMGAHASQVRHTDVVGLSTFVVGYILETGADWQKEEWARLRAEKKHKEEFFRGGLWTYCRHPNYMGEIIVWLGIATIAAGVVVEPPVHAALGLPLGVAVLLSYVSPLFVTYVLMAVSGIPLTERKMDMRCGHLADYQDWKRDTYALIPKIF